MDEKIIDNIKNTEKNAIKNKILILSGKGGVGKSTVTYSIANELNKRGYKIGIFDADFEMPNIPQVIGLSNDIRLVVEHKQVLPHIHDNMKIMSLAFAFPSNTAIMLMDSKKRELITQIMECTNWGEIDYMLFDAPAGSGRELKYIMQDKPKGAIIVTTPHASSVADAERALYMLKYFRVPLIGIIHNMSYIVNNCENCSHSQTIKFDFTNTKEKNDVIGEFPLSVDVLKTNILPDIEKTVDLMLEKLKTIKPIKSGKGKIHNLKYMARKYKVKKMLLEGK